MQRKKRVKMRKRSLMMKIRTKNPRRRVKMKTLVMRKTESNLKRKLSRRLQPRSTE